MHIQTSRNLSKGYGRVEICTIKTSSELAGSSDWPHLAQVLMLKSEWRYKGEWKEDLRYAVSSLSDTALTIEKLAQYKRVHWSIENKLHRVRDVIFGEDASLTRKGSEPVVMASLCNMVLNIMRLQGINKITTQLRRNVAQSHRILELLGLA